MHQAQWLVEELGLQLSPPATKITIKIKGKKKKEKEKYTYTLDKIVTNLEFLNWEPLVDERFSLKSGGERLDKIEEVSNVFL